MKCENNYFYVQFHGLWVIGSDENSTDVPRSTEIVHDFGSYFGMSPALQKSSVTNNTMAFVTIL